MTQDAPDRIVITLLTPEGTPGARVRTGADGGAESEILDERSRARAERVMDHLSRPRPPRRRPGCIDGRPSEGA